MIIELRNYNENRHLLVKFKMSESHFSFSDCWNDRFVLYCDAVPAKVKEYRHQIGAKFELTMQHLLNPK